MSKCVNCLKEINEKEVFCLTCHEEVLECAKNRIADLEAKLAESEKKASKKNDESWDLYLSLKQFYSRLGVEAYADDEIQDVAVKELNRLLNENEELKQQLAEKDEEIAYLTKQVKKFNNEAQKYFEDAYCNDSIYQDKISFAIEQLEKVIKDIDCYMAIREGDLPDDIEGLLLDFVDKIDNQINVLRNNKDGIHKKRNL